MPTDNVVAESWQYTTAQTVDRNARYFLNWRNLDKQFEPWLALYREIADYEAPGRGRFIDFEGQANQKTRAAAKIINPVTPDAIHMLGAGLHGGLSSPARPWFQLEFEDPGLNKFTAGKEWLDDCEKVLYGVLKRSNFYNLIHNVYEEVGAFATGALFVDSHPQRVLNFSYLTAGDYRIAVNQFGLCHCMYRRIRMQAHQMASMFGVENLSETTRRLLETNQYEWRDLLHIIEPNTDYDPEGMSATQYKYRSIYIEWKENQKRLSDSGFHEMPIVTPRWMALSHEPYGWGPGPEALGLSKAIQRMEATSMLVEEKYVNPPMGMGASFKDRMVDLSPGAKNTFKEGTNIKDSIVRLVEIDPNSIGIYESKITSVENKIRRLFFYELFLMIANEDRRMTATEVAARQEEKMIMLGPIIESLLYELLDPAIDRVFNLCARAGLLPPPPRDVADAQYKVQYVSILAQAQKLIQAQGMSAYRQAAGEVAQISPESVDKTNWDQYLENFGDMLNMPTKIVREDDEVAKIREARAAEAQKQQEIIEDQANADTMNKLGGATVADDTALGQIQNSMGV